MSLPTPSTRRDPRYDLEPGIATLEFDPPTGDAPCLAAVTHMSTSGMGLILEGEAEWLTQGSQIVRSCLRVGECELWGDLMIRNVRTTDEGQTEFGCLFLPGSVDDQRLFMALVTGLEAACKDVP